MVPFVLSPLVLLCGGVRTAATLLETLVAMLLVAILALIVTVTAYSVFKGFTHVTKEHYLYDPKNSHPSGNTRLRGSPNPPP